MIEKPNLNESEIQANYDEFIDFISKTFKGERKKALLKMYSDDELGQSAAMSPASTNEHFHLCHPGGYLQHIMHVVKNTFGVKKLYELNGGTVDWTDEEMVFAAVHHDLGKLGDPEHGEYYVVQDESWKEKRGDKYKLNKNLPYMEVTDRAVYLLQKYDVKYTYKEYLGIKLADGIYNEANKKYLVQFNPDLFLKTDMPRIIHLADYLACFAERNVMINAKIVESL
jgi:hypothetical protein